MPKTKTPVSKPVPEGVDLRVTNVERAIQGMIYSKRATKRASRLTRLSNDELEALIDGGRITNGDIKDLLKDGRPHTAAEAILAALACGNGDHLSHRTVQITLCYLVKVTAPEDPNDHDRRDRRLIRRLANAIAGPNDFEGPGLLNVDIQRYLRRFGHTELADEFFNV